MNYWDMSCTFCQTCRLPEVCHPLYNWLYIGEQSPPPLSINCHDYYSFCIFHSKIWSYEFPSFVRIVPLGCAPKICSFIHLYQNMEIYNYHVFGVCCPRFRWVLLRFVVSYIYNIIWKYLIIMFCRVCYPRVSREPPPPLCPMNKLIFGFIIEKSNKIGFTHMWFYYLCQA